MKKFLLIILLVFPYYFSDSQNIEIIGAKKRYYLSQEEQTLKLDSGLLNIYFPFNADLETPIPLQKAIKSNNYKLFIGLALNKTPEQLNNYFKKNIPENKIYKINDTIIAKTKIYKFFVYDNGYYNYKIIFKTRKTVYTAVLNYISEDSSAIADLYFDNNFIEKKLGKKIK